tara:strand:+ start:666 stop:905 length:240 start_codon:yes stop_codon:yes gene_type:complete
MFISSKLKLEYINHVSNLTKGIKNPKMNGAKQRIKTKKIFLFFTGIFENVFWLPFMLLYLSLPLYIFSVIKIEKTNSIK